MYATKFMRTGALSLALCAGSALAYETDSLKPFPVLKPVPEYLSKERRGFDSAPSVTIMRGGRLWVAWHAGGKTEADVRAGRLVNPISRLGDVITAAPAR